jgi:Secretion system C-terminal sorting domain
MRLIRLILSLLILAAGLSTSYGQDSNIVNYSIFLEKSVITDIFTGTVDTKIDEGQFKEGQGFLIPEAVLPSNFLVYQDLYNALVGGRFSIDFGALENDLIMKIFIRNLKPDLGEYLNLGQEEDTLFSYFEIRIWELPDSNFYPEASSYHFNEGFYARFSLPKSDALHNFLNAVGIGNQDSLAFAFMEDINTGTDGWNGYGIETIDDPDSVKFKAIHLSRIGGGRKRIADTQYNPGTVNSINIIHTEGIPNKAILNQNYPNPFNPATKISYSINESGHVSLDIYNILGRQVLTLVNQNQYAGNYEVEFSTSNMTNKLPSGIYIYTLKNKNVTLSKKMILMK